MTKFCIFGLAPLDLRFSFKFRLDSIYTFRDIAVVRMWHFGWKMPVWSNCRQFFRILTPKIGMSLF